LLARRQGKRIANDGGGSERLLVWGHLEVLNLQVESSPVVEIEDNAIGASINAWDYSDGNTQLDDGRKPLRTVTHDSSSKGC